MNAAVDRFTIGDRFLPGRATDMAAPSVSFGGHGVTIALVVAEPGPAMIDAARAGVITYAWTASPHAALLCVKLTGPGGEDMTGWIDIPYHVGTDPHARTGQGTPGVSMQATLILVDGTGTITAVRKHLWPARSADKIRTALDLQTRTGLDTHAKRAWLTELRERHPRLQDLAAHADAIWTDTTDA